MAKNKHDKQNKEEKKSAQDYYKLHGDEIDDLISANADNTPEYSKEELEKYRTKRKIKFSDTLKVLLIKFWFNGSVNFFFFMGLGYYVRDSLDQLFVLGFAMGIVTDILVNNVLRFIAKPEGANDRWMMFPKKQLSSLFLNILYAFVVLLFVYMFYNVVNSVLNSLGKGVLAVEPVLFGVVYLGFDVLFISLKHLMVRVINDAKGKVRN